MRSFTILCGVAVPLDESNVDTDQICPARLIRLAAGPDSERIAFHDRRFDADERPRPDFVLNDPVFSGASILVAARNFGVGSSREAAVTVLASAGFRCIIAESFGDIFHNNCFKNGLLPIRLAPDRVKALRDAILREPGAKIRVDLHAQTVTGPRGASMPFTISALRRQCLLEGLDDLALTDRYEREIEAFEAAYHARLPWLCPS